MSFLVGKNMAGCLPDNEPDQYETWEEAHAGFLVECAAFVHDTEESMIEDENDGFIDDPHDVMKSNYEDLGAVRSYEASPGEELTVTLLDERGTSWSVWLAKDLG